MTPRPLEEGDIPAATALCETVGFAPDPAIWRWLLSLGPGWGVCQGDGSLVGTVTLVPFGPSLAMLAMMVVHPDHQRRGLGRALVQAAVEAEPHATIALYATEVGEKLYRAMGFVEAGESTRFEGEPIGLPEPTAGRRFRRLTAADLVWIAEVDAVVQGARRDDLLRSLLSPRVPPTVAYALEGADGSDGFGIASLERGTWRIGPVVASSDADAIAIADHLAQRKEHVRLDLEPSERALGEWARARGLTPSQRSPRMTLGEPMPGDRARSRAIAGRPFG